MNITALEATFIRHERRSASEEFLRLNPPGSPGHRDYQDFFVHCSFAEAHGIWFLCPKSFLKNGGRIGTHHVQVFFVGSPVPPEIGQNAANEMVRWNKSGTGLSDLTLTPSIQEQDDSCDWHGFVTNGDAS